MGKKLKKQKENSLWLLKIMEYISYLVVFLVPLFVGKNHLYSFLIPKSLLMVGLVILMVIFYLFIKWQENESKITFDPLKIILLIFLGILTLSSLFGVDKINSFFGWYQSVNLIFLYFLSIFAYLIGYLIKKDRDFLKKILLASFFSSILVTTFFYFKIANSFDIQGGTIGNSSYLGAYLLFNICFGLGLFFLYSKIWQKILIGISLVFVSINPIFFNKDFLTGKVSFSEIIQSPFSLLGISNGATLGLFVSIIIMGIFLFIFSNKKYLKILGLILFICFNLGVYFVGNSLIRPESSLNKVFVEKKGQDRFLAWDIAKASYHSHPLLGSGLNNYIYDYKKYFSTEFYDGGKIKEFFQPHNIFLEYFSNNGLLGLVSYLFLLVAIIINLLFKNNQEEEGARKINYLKIIIIGLIFGYFIQNLFVFDTIVTYLMLFLVIGVALGLSDFSWSIKFNSKFNFFKKVIIVFCLTGFIYLFVIFVMNPWGESKIWNKLTLSSNNILEMSPSNRFQEISLMGGIFDSTILANKYLDLFKENINKIDKENQKIFFKQIDSVIDLVEGDIKKQSNYSESYLVIANLLNIRMMTEIRNFENETILNEDNWNKALAMFNKALKLDPNNSRVYFGLSELYLIKGDIETSRMFIKKGLLLDPKNDKLVELSKIIKNEK